MEKYANCDQFLCHVDDCYLVYLNKKILGETFEPKGVFQSDEPFTLRGYKNFLGKPVSQITSFFDIENMVKLIRIKMVNLFQFLFTVSGIRQSLFYFQHHMKLFLIAITAFFIIWCTVLIIIAVVSWKNWPC